MGTGFRSSKEYTDWVEYKRAQKQAITEYRRVKRNFEIKLAENITRIQNLSTLTLDLTLSAMIELVHYRM